MVEPATKPPITWLAGFVFGGGQLLPHFAAGACDDALGERGTADYRRLITLAWRRNPSGWHEKYLMQELHLRVVRPAGPIWPRRIRLRLSRARSPGWHPRMLV
jgi:hypothetical protein